MKKTFLVALLTLTMAFAVAFVTPVAQAVAADKCGGGDGIETSINIGCTGEGEPVTDMAFAIIRFLSAGVGLVIVGSIIWGGLQYIGSRDDPNSVAQAVGRIRSSVIALLIYIFAFAILNYVIPRGFIFR